MRLLRIALIYGGAGCEHAVSVLGGENLRRILAQRREFEILPVFIDKAGDWYLKKRGKYIPTYPVRRDCQSGFLVGRKILPVCCAIPLLHGDFGEDGRVQGALDCAGIRCVGSGVVGGALCSDKIYTKIIAESLGVPTVPYIAPTTPSAAEARSLAEEKIGYPMFIKPACLGSSIGAHEVPSAEDFDAAYADAYTRGGARLLIERLVSPRRELECACLIDKEGIRVSHPGEIKIESFYSYHEKYSTESKAKLCLHSDIPREIEERLSEYCRILCEGLSVRGLCRIDFFLSGDEIYLNEINTMPGFTESSLYLRLMKETGLGEHELVLRLINEAMERAEP